jgi:hypothetical protein
MRTRLGPALATVLLTGFAGVARAEPATLDITIKDHRFEPAEIRAPANTPIILNVKNLDPTPEEFESKPLRAEKVIPGAGSATFRVNPLKAGRYSFFGEFHEDTAKGVLVVE